MIGNLDQEWLEIQTTVRNQKYRQQLEWGWLGNPEGECLGIQTGDGWEIQSGDGWESRVGNCGELLGIQGGDGWEIQSGEGWESIVEMVGESRCGSKWELQDVPAAPPSNKQRTKSPGDDGNHLQGK